jgi:hypothetical protein
MSDLSNDTKKHTTKSRETIPLNLFFVPPGHIIQYFPVQALYPEPCARPYEIRTLFLPFMNSKKKFCNTVQNKSFCHKSKEK